MNTKNTNTQEILDLRSSSKLSKEQSLLLDKIAVELKPQYTEFISNLLDDPNNNIQLFLTPLMCRNNYDCKLFNRLCELELIKQYFSTRESGIIILDNPYLYEAVKSICDPGIRIINTKSKLQRAFNIFLRNIKIFIVMTFTFLSRYVASMFIRSSGLNEDQSEITIIDTIFYKNSFKKNKFNDRHFPGILDGLSSYETDSIYYIGYYYRVLNFFSLFRAIKSSSSKIIIIEKYLRLKDYVYAAFSFLYLFKIRNFKDLKFNDCHITSLFMDSFYENIINIGSSEGILKYRLMYRLNQKGIKISSFLMWFENLPNNRGTQIGLNNFHPDTNTNGYIGFFHSNTVVGIYPTSQEYIAGFLPKNISVMGKKILPEIKSFCPQLKVIISPAYRFQSLLRTQELKQTKQLTILVALPIFIDESCNILELVYSAVKDLSKTVVIKIKIHPGSSKKIIEKYIYRLGLDADNISNTPMHRAILESSIVLSSASSAAVESVLLGTPTLIISDRRNPTKNPIPLGVPEDLHAVCYDSKDIKLKIENFLDDFPYNSRLFKKIGLECQNYYVEKFSSDKSKALLGISNLKETIHT